MRDLRGILAAPEQPLVMVTAYDVAGARFAEAAGVDLILVGDSAGMVVLGDPDTTDTGLGEMLRFTRAVARGAAETPIIGDMPRGTYERDDATACANAHRFVDEAGAHAVKVEGAGPIVERVRAIVAERIPVIGHLGLTPQSVHALGGFKAQARSGTAALTLLGNARALEEAGAVALVLEAIPAPVAAAVTERLSIPTIGIGAGSGTTGQVLVYHDILGLSGGQAPRFVRRYAELGPLITGAIRQYADEVRAGRFPAKEHTYPMPEAELAEFRRGLSSDAH